MQGNEIQNQRSTWGRSQFRDTCQDHIVGLILTLIDTHPFRIIWILPFMRYSYFKIWPWESKAKVSDIKGQSASRTMKAVTGKVAENKIPIINWESSPISPWMKWPPFCRWHCHMYFMKGRLFPFEFHWRLFPRVQWPISQHCFRWWLGTEQVTFHYLN